MASSPELRAPVPRDQNNFPRQSAINFAAVTPSDSVNLGAGVRGLYVGVAGNVVAVTIDDVAVTFTDVPAGLILPIECKRVNSTSTTATNIVVLY